jgi:glycosyltransferase involved in cell wall biosynthesis
MLKVDVVIPSFEDKRVVEAISSVYKCDLQEVSLSIYVQIGGSSEQFKSMIAGNFPDVIIGCEEDKNIFDGINLGLKKCRGHYILTIGSDDRIVDRSLFQKLVECHKKDVDFIFCGLEYTDENWAPLRRWPARLLKRSRYIMGRQYPHFGFLCRPRIYEEIGYFNSDNPTNADYEFFWHLACKIKEKKYAQKLISSYSVQMKLGGNSSQSKLRIIQHNILLLRFAMKRAKVLILAILIFKWFYKIAEYIRTLQR